MKRLLVLSYYFPPMGMSGVQRTLKFVKYLPQFGWQPVVLTIKSRGSYGYDWKLLDEIPDIEIYRTHSLDPLYLSPSKHNPSAAARGNIASRINRLFIPDNKLGWIPFAIDRGLTVARDNRIDAIYSSAPPFSSHLAALALKKKLGKPLICDFRDAWTENPQTSYANPLHEYFDLMLERKVLRESDLLLAINQEIVDSFITKHPGIRPDKFRVLPQGFDPADFEGVDPEKFKKFTIVYTGTFVGKRTPEPLIKALSVIRQGHPEIFENLQVIIAGAFRDQDRELARRAGMESVVEFRGYLPHRESISLLKAADILWMVIHPSEGPTVATGKIYEYLGANKPILASVPEDGAAARLIKDIRLCKALPFTGSDLLAKEIVRLYGLLNQGKKNSQPEYAGNFDRKRIASLLGKELDKICP